MLLQIEFEVQAVPEPVIKRAIRDGLLIIKIEKAKFSSGGATTSGKKTKKAIELEKRMQSFNVVLTPVEKKIVNAWNNNPFIKKLEKDRGDETRNYPILDKDFTKSFLELFRKTIKRVGDIEILRLMDIYFSMCEGGDHIWSSTNHGFKNLYGFLYKIYITYLEGEKKVWWDKKISKEIIEDSNAEITQMFADAYANRFLRKSSFKIENPSNEYRTFVKLRKKIERRTKKSGGMVDKKMLIRALDLLFDAIEDCYSESIIHPATLISKNVWEVVLPQYLKKREG